LEQQYIDIIYDIYVKEFNCSSDDINIKYLICNTVVSRESIRIFHSDRDTKIIHYTHTIKYGLTSDYFRVPMELFKCRSDEIVGTVSQFHFPIVRSYYNGKTVMVTTSCIGACKTLTNIDYKFFAGVRDPMIIWIKYWGRGFGFIFNGTEMSKFVSFCINNDEYVRERGIHIYKTYHLGPYLTSLHFTHEIYTNKIENFSPDTFNKCELSLASKQQSYDTPFKHSLKTTCSNGNVKPLNYHMIITMYEFNKTKIGNVTQYAPSLNVAPALDIPELGSLPADNFDSFFNETAENAQQQFNRMTRVQETTNTPSNHLSVQPLFTAGTMEFRN